MGWRIGRGLFSPFDDFAGGDAHHDHVLGGHHAVIHARGFDHKHALLTIDGADVTPGEGDEVVFRQGQIGFQHLTFEIF
ncbi:hypothetical protein D3C85_1609810 [compost metagenome]